MIEGPDAGAKVIVLLDRGETHGDDPHGLAARAVDVRRNGLIEHEGAQVFAEVFGPPPRLVVVGAVDTSEALCAAAKRDRLAHDLRRGPPRASRPPNGCRAPTRSSSNGPRKRSRRSAPTATPPSSC